MHETDFGRESYDSLKLAQPSSFLPELGQESPTKEVSSASHSSCRRAQHKWSTHAAQCRRAHAAQHKRSAHAAHGEELMQLSTKGQHSSCRRAHAAQHKRSAQAAHAGELMQLSTRGQLMQKSSCSST